MPIIERMNQILTYITMAVFDRKNQVYAFIYFIIAVLIVTAFSFPKTLFANQTIPSQLIIEMDGDIRFYLDQPSGERNGSWRFDHDLEAQNLVDVSLQNKYQALVYENPDFGIYTIDTDYRFDDMATSELRITYIDGENERYSGYTGDIATIHDNNNKFTFTINQTGDEVIIFGEEFIPLQNLHVFKTQDNKTKLTWDARETSDKILQTYRIYKYQDNADFDYRQVGETMNTEYLTDINWGSSELQPGVPSDYTAFVVTRVFTDGTESVLSSPAYNNDSDQDGFSDEEEAELGTDADNPDTDGDTLNDFIEVNLHNTNPIKKDTDNDGFDDNVEIEAGTSPLDPNFFPDDSCDKPQEGDWYINKDCDLEKDTTAPADVIIGNNADLTLKEQVTLWFDSTKHKILVMLGSSIYLQKGASIKSTQ